MSVGRLVACWRLHQWQVVQRTLYQVGQDHVLHQVGKCIATAGHRHRHRLVTEELQQCPGLSGFIELAQNQAGLHVVGLLEHAAQSCGRGIGGNDRMARDVATQRADVGQAFVHLHAGGVDQDELAVFVLFQ